MVRLKKLYEDNDVEVYRSFDESELEEAIVDAIREAGRPLSWRELRSIFSGIAGEDRLKKILVKLINEDRIVEMPDGAFGLPEMVDSYVPDPKVKRVRPLVPAKFYERWEPSPSVFRRAGRPLGELLGKIREKTAALQEPETESELGSPEL